MKNSKVSMLAAGLGICALFITGTAFSDESTINDMEKKKIESTMMANDSGIKKPMADEMGNTMKTEMEEPMKAGMEDTMKVDMAEPMKAEMEDTMKPDMAEPMKAGIEDTMKTEMVKPMKSSKK